MNEMPPVQGLPTHRSCPYDPPDDYTRLRAERPVVPIVYPDGNQGWLLSRYEDVKTLLTDPRFSSERSRSARTRHRDTKPAMPPGAFISMDPPEHTRYRRLVSGRFTTRKMRELEPRVEAYARQFLDRMEEKGGPVDLVEEYALPIPSLVISDLLGVPSGSRADFQRWSADVLNVELPLDQIKASINEFSRFMQDLIAFKKKEPGDDLISDLVHPGSEDDRLTDDEVAGLCTLMLIAGHESTSNMLSLGTLVTLRNEDQLSALRENPALIDSAVEELLRYLSIVQFSFTRTALEDMEIGGHRIEAGQTVVGAMVSANRDPESFPDPDRLIFDRQDARNLAFGHGVHMCIGHQLARIEMKVAFRRLFERFPTLRIAVPDDQIRFKTDSVVYGVWELPVTWDATR
ncbi:cytochrome P450 [Streptomyces botrytidirepellens]|uniref:Cytochrome P450 n=1 Tax=Streptomyces botrytidirepellens TaxID=2486417 RepID=A0A3M8X190_9ACTN|nr:cytochrome P450 [Streptomyces botrytidirepellens]RNG34163.1 cytochrome P450 [Streptomyces botrytidirepellens]